MAFYYNTKILFFGGLQIFPGDNTIPLIYSFCTINNEWVIEPYKDPHSSNHYSQFIVYI
jgi:hypothetical protein